MAKLTDIRIDYSIVYAPKPLKILRVNSLDDSHSKYITYRRGRKGSNNYECGTILKRMKKEKVTWKKIGTSCDPTKDIWEITEK